MSQELQMLPKSLSECQSLTLNVMIWVSQFVRNGQLYQSRSHKITKLPPMSLSLSERSQVSTTALQCSEECHSLSQCKWFTQGQERQVASRKKYLAAEESTAMEVILPSLNWKPICPDESWAKTRSWLEKAMPCLLRRWIPCEGWGSSQRADPWQPLLCCSRPPFSSGHAPEDMQSGHVTKSSWGTHLVRGEASKVDSVDLEDLVAEPETTQCCWRPFGDKTDKHSCAKKLLIQRGFTKTIKDGPLLTAFTRRPILPSASLHRITCLTPRFTWKKRVL